MVNKAFILGNIGKSPELKYTNNGTAVCSFTVATSEKYKGEERTTWHNVQAWGKLAEICAEYLEKGKQVYIEGKISNRSYEDANGNKKFVSEIVAETMRMVGGRGQRDDNQKKSQPSAQYQGHEPQFNPDDDIPF